MLYLICGILVGVVVGFVVGVVATWAEVRQELESGIVTNRGAVYRVQKVIDV